MRNANREEALKLRDHAVRCLERDNPSWSHLLTLGERILLERSIIVR